MPRILADLGNTRLKWARLDESGRVVEVIALPLDQPPTWAVAWSAWNGLDEGRSSWAVSSVNPPVAEALEAFFRERRIEDVRWIRSAAEVPTPMDVEGAHTGGSDRALAVLAARRIMPAERPGLVVMCGTAITVERLDAAGTWQGGAIAPGLALTARALHLMTAQLPWIELDVEPPAWGRDTRGSLEAGIFWGIVGAVRELIERQRVDMGERPWVIWTGGDSALLAPRVSGPEARVEPNLILAGIAEVAFDLPVAATLSLSKHEG